jgi:cytochrome c oxidase subunit I+III
VSSIVTTFARRPIFGYTAIVLSLVAIGIASFGLWVHHMFTTGLPELG